jgi:hypothetical protein
MSDLGNPVLMLALRVVGGIIALSLRLRTERWGQQYRGSGSISAEIIRKSEYDVFGVPVGASDLPCNWSVYSSPLFFPAADRVVNSDPERSYRRAGLRLFQEKVRGYE